MKYIAIDFEYRKTNEQVFDLVAVALCIEGDEPKAAWLHNHFDNKNILKNLLRVYGSKDYIFISFNAEAEASAVISLGLNPRNFKWFDPQMEWKMLINGNNEFQYGKHYIDGKIKTTKPKPGYWEKKSEEPNDKAPVNLEGVTYALLKELPEDRNYKATMRDLIIDSDNFNEQQREEILTYAKSDVRNLFRLKNEILKCYKDLGLPEENLMEEILWRGRTQANTALMTRIGYPVNREGLESLTKAIPDITKDLQEEINSYFPNILPFELNKKTNSYTLKVNKLQAYFEDYILKHEIKDWKRTDNGKLALDEKTTDTFLNYSSPYSTMDFAEQFVRYKKTIKSLRGFPTTDKTLARGKSFFDYLGSDERVRPYLNAYGSQTSRFQPKSIGFIPLKANFMRCLIAPKPGRAVVGIDYGSQEFLISALLSKDQEMINAYFSGDVYLYFGKAIGMIPPEGTKTTHKRERNICKPFVLGISYGKGAKALAREITNNKSLNMQMEEYEAQDIIDAFYDLYSDYDYYIKQCKKDYRIDNNLKLNDGWYMFGDNPNERSVGNFPIQGAGGAILRKAIDCCFANNICVIMPLHDALYCEYDSKDLTMVDALANCMRMAFVDYFDNDMKPYAEKIFMDAGAWSPDYTEGTVTTPNGMRVDTQKIYVDPDKGKSDFEKYRKYLGSYYN